MRRMIFPAAAALLLCACENLGPRETLLPDDEVSPAQPAPGQQAPAPQECVVSVEVCDGFDNDCDGNTDEGVKNDCGGCGALTIAPNTVVVRDAPTAPYKSGYPCSVTAGATSSTGTAQCLTATQLYCDAPGQEQCPDGKDNDYDGLVDECEVGKAVDTKYAAVEPQMTGDCSGRNACGGPCYARVPAEDCGSPADDDCDGEVNEGCPAPTACSANAEVCNEQDDDCDGSIDEGVKNDCGGCGALTIAPNTVVVRDAPTAPYKSGYPCSVTAGATSSTGTAQCLTATQLYCDAPGQEQCPDGKDNDYDGLVDECELGQTTDTKFGGVEPLRR